MRIVRRQEKILSEESYASGYRVLGYSQRKRGSYWAYGWFLEWQQNLSQKRLFTKGALHNKKAMVEEKTFR